MNILCISKRTFRLELPAKMIDISKLSFWSIVKNFIGQVTTLFCILIQDFILFLIVISLFYEFERI